MVLDVLEGESLRDNARHVGRYLMDRLREMDFVDLRWRVYRSETLESGERASEMVDGLARGILCARMVRAESCIEDSSAVDFLRGGCGVAGQYIQGAEVALKRSACEIHDISDKLH